MTQINLVHAPYHFLKIHFSIILKSRLRFSKWSLSLRFPTKILYTSLLYPIHTTYPTHFPLLDFITRIIFDEKYRSLSSSLCNFLHSPVTPSLLYPNILLSTLFSNTVGLRSSFSVSDQFSHPHKTISTIIVLCFSILHFWIANWKTKDSTPNDSKHSLNSICS